MRDRADLNHEILGEGTNRIRRYLSESGPDFFGEDKKKKEERQHLSRLQELLLDAEYKAAYDIAIRTFYQTQNNVYAALTQTIEDLYEAQKNHNALLERASTLPGNAYLSP